MGRPVEIFVESFHKLEGNTIGERQKNLNFLLRDLKGTQQDLTKEDIEILDQSLIPKTLLENIFKLHVFIQLKYTPFLLRIFESHNLYLIGKLVKEKWFFEEAFQDISGEVLTREIFPGVSFITRQKVINKLAAYLQDRNLAADYFESIQNKYGLNQAKNLLPACAPSFIRSVMQKYDIKFTNQELTKIVKKDHSFAEFYLKTSRTDINDYQLVLKYLAIHDIHLFIKLFEEYDVRMKMNAKLTAEIFQMRKKNIIQKPLKYLPSLNIKKTVSLLNEEFEEFYKNCFPKNIDEFEAGYEKNTSKEFDCNGLLHRLIQHLPPSKQYELLTKTFLGVYNTELLNCPEFIKEPLLEIMPEQERDKWVEIKYKEDEKYICYFNTCKSIRLIKEKIKLTAVVAKRSALLNYLVQTCAINKDEVALLDVLKYFENRHRNEDTRTINSFLETVNEYFKLERFSSEYWVVIRKLIGIIYLKQEFTSCKDKYALNYIHYLLLNEHSDPEFSKVIQELFTKCYVFDYNLLTKNQAFEKKILLQISKAIVEIYKEEELINRCEMFISSVGNWNKRHPDDFIDPYSFPKIIEIILTPKKESLWLSLETIKTLFRPTTENDLKEFVEDRVWENLNKIYYANFLVDILLATNPERFALHVEDILKLDKDMKSVWRKAKLYSHLQIPENILQYCRTKLNGAEEYDSNCVVALSILMPSAEFLEVMSDYYPTNANVINISEERYSIQKTFMKQLVYVDDYSLTFPILLKFCRGDYLHSILSSLNYIVENTLEEQSKEFLDSIMERAVSVKKHAIFLVANISDSEKIYNVLKAASSKENNSSLHKFILKRTFKYFCNNQSEISFQLFVENAKFLNKKDEEAYEYFLNVKQVPHQYKARFIETAWENIKESDLDEIKKRRFELLTDLNNEEISNLADTLCKQILNDLFCYENINDLHQFYCKYLILNNQEEKLKYFFSLMRNEKEKSAKVKKRNIKFRAIILSFLKENCSYCLKNNEKEFLNMFANHWYKIMKPTVAFEEHLIFQFSLLYLNCPLEQKLRNFAEKISQFYVETLNKYGTAILDKFSTILQSNIYDFMSNLDGTYNEHKIQFLVDLINLNKSPDIYVLILASLPRKYSVSKELSNKHKMILNEIEASKDPVVQIYYNAYLLQMDVSEDCDN